MRLTIQDKARKELIDLIIKEPVISWELHDALKELEKHNEVDKK